MAGSPAAESNRREPGSEWRTPLLLDFPWLSQWIKKDFERNSWSRSSFAAMLVGWVGGFKRKGSPVELDPKVDGQECMRGVTCVCDTRCSPYPITNQHN